MIGLDSICLSKYTDTADGHLHIYFNFAAHAPQTDRQTDLLNAKGEKEHDVLVRSL